VSEPVFKKWTKEEHLDFVAGLKHLDLSPAVEITEQQWKNLALFVAGRLVYDVKLHARTFWNLPVATTDDKNTIGQKRDFVEPLPVAARKKQRFPGAESATNATGNENEMETVPENLSGSLSLTSSMLGLLLSNNDENSSIHAPTTPTSSLSLFPTPSMSSGDSTPAFGLPLTSDGVWPGNMNHILANQLLEENVQIITLMRENLLSGNIKINYKLMNKFAANISRILNWQAMQPACANMPPLPIKINTTFIPSPASAQHTFPGTQQPTAFDVGLTSASLPSAASPPPFSSSESPAPSLSELGVCALAPIVISPPPSP